MDANQGIQVTFLDQTGAKSVKARISPTVTVKKIIPSIITKMQLPVTMPDGTPTSYSLDHKEGGKRLLENQTLPDAGVKEGDHLIVYPEVVAGAGVKLNYADRLIFYTVAVILMCVAVRAVLEVAATVIVPTIIVGVGYAVFRLWQTGLLGKFAKKFQQHPKESDPAPETKEETNGT